MQITSKIHQVKDVFEKVVKVLTLKLRKMLNESSKSTKNHMRSTKICWKISHNRKPAPCRN